MLKVFLILPALVSFLLCFPHAAWSHGFAGQRFFPATILTDDPFVNDELGFTVGHHRQAGEPASREIELEAEYSKTLTSKLGLSVGAAVRNVDPVGDGGGNAGFGNTDIGLKYQFLTVASHEAVVSVGVNAEIGGSGAKKVESDSFWTITPALYFGKGMGGLPTSMNYLRPLALTGLVAVNLPTRSRSFTSDGFERHPSSLAWGFALEYSIPYLQASVKDVGFQAPFDRMVPLVEFSAESCLHNGCTEGTTGTVAPGLIWFGQSVQWGIEAQIPVNSPDSGVGALVQLHFFLDDLFPAFLGRPLL